MTHIEYRITCDSCNRVDCDGFDEEKALIDHAKSIGWTFSEVQNGSIWDICPKCAEESKEFNQEMYCRPISFI